MTIRAVHLEVDPSRDTSSCARGEVRFIARRGTPSVIWSDISTKFLSYNIFETLYLSNSNLIFV